MGFRVPSEVLVPAMWGLPLRSVHHLGTSFHGLELQLHGSASSELLQSGNTNLSLFVFQAPGVVAASWSDLKVNFCPINFPAPFKLTACIKILVLK